MTTADTQHPVLVHLRPNSNTVFFVLAFLLVDVIILLNLVTHYTVYFKPGTPHFLWLVVPSAVAGMIPALAGLYYRLHARLELGELGLRWRTWGDWRRVPWDGVRDYYDLPLRNDSSGGDLMAIKTELGIVILNRRWRESEPVRLRVQAMAKDADTAKWGVLGQRTCAADTRTFGADARTFVYLQGDCFVFPAIGLGFFLPITLYNWHFMLHPVGRSFWGMMTEGWKPSHLWSSLGSVAVNALVLFLFAYLSSIPMLVFLLNVPSLVVRRERRHQQITTQQNGITFEDDRQRIDAKWSEITRYLIHPSKASRSALFRFLSPAIYARTGWRWVFIAETTHGSFEYTSLIEGSKQLGQILKDHGIVLTRGSDSD